MPTKKKKAKKTGLFGGMLGIAERGIRGTAKRMAAEEAKATGKKKKKKAKKK